jgi:flagellar biosynthesis chaperone FliJ
MNVREILQEKKLDEYTSTATREQLIELRNAASVQLGKQKLLTETSPKQLELQKYINFLSAVIQECDTAIAKQKVGNKNKMAELIETAEKFKKFKRLVCNRVGQAAYQELLKELYSG